MAEKLSNTKRKARQRAAARAILDIGEALEWPQDPHGRPIMTEAIRAQLAYHLARAGCVIDPEAALIKKRRIPLGPGIIAGACEWVDIDDPDTIQDELDGADVANLHTLSPTARGELIRRAGGGVMPLQGDLDSAVPWKVTPTVDVKE